MTGVLLLALCLVAAVAAPALATSLGPAAPTGLSAAFPARDATTLAWTDTSNDETGFVVQRSRDPQFSSTLDVPLPADTTTYTDREPVDGPSFYRVKAVNDLGDSGPTPPVRGSRIKDLTFEDGSPDLVHPFSGATRNAGARLLPEASSVIAGRHSARVPGLANAYLEQSVEAGEELKASFYLRLHKRPPADSRVFLLTSGTTNIASLWVRSNGVLCLKYGLSWSGNSVAAACTPASSPLATGPATYRIGIRLKRGDGSSTARIEGSWARVDPQSPEQTGRLTPFTSTEVAPDAPGYWQAAPTALRIGATLTSVPLDATVDDVKVDSAFMPGPSSDLDGTRPEISVALPDEGRTYELGEDVATRFSCEDSGSGIAADGCQGPERLDTGAAGDRTFRVVARDRAGNEATREVTYRVVDPAPVARDDTAGVPASGGLLIDPVRNDSGSDLSVRRIVGHASYGAAELIEDGPDAGRIRYRAPSGFEGSDWFDYEVCDLRGACDTATVGLRIRTITAGTETNPPIPREVNDPSDASAIWVNPDDPAASAVVTTDRAEAADHSGLSVYGLDGERISETGGGVMNDVDVRTDVGLDTDTDGAQERINLVTAANRSTRSLSLLSLDRATRRLDNAAGRNLPLGLSPYGTCTYRSPEGPLYAFVTSRDGEVEQWRLYDDEAGRIDGQRVRSFRLRETNSEARTCAVDDATGALYIAEENRGIWRYGAEPEDSTERRLVDSTDRAGGGHLTADVRGLTVVRHGAAAGSLIASSQGSDDFVVYGLGAGNSFERRFSVSGNDGVDGAEQTDGIDATAADLGPSFPGGVLVAHDRSNDATTLNHKLVRLDEALGEASAGVADPRPSSCSRPYSDTSPWNTAISPDASYHPDSDFHIEAFRDPADPAVYEKLGSDPTQYTYPVFEVDASTPQRDVRVGGTFSDVTGSETQDEQLVHRRGATVRLPFPERVAAAEGSDGQVIIVDRATGDEWGFWQLEKDPATGEWSATNGYHYNTRWDAVPPLSIGGNPFGSRGAGVPYHAGLVTPCEIARGEVDHALAFAYSTPTPEHVYPATKSDGGKFGTPLPEDMPEGSRLQLDPSISPKEIASWGCTGPCLTMARALQRHGMYLIDNAGHPKVMLEYEDTARWGGRVGPRTTEPIPLNRFKLLQPPSG